jgi:hypothetical protein
MGDGRDVPVNAPRGLQEQYGDWDRSPLTGTSPEIITIARPGAWAGADSVR